MRTTEAVELLAAGVRVLVPRATGFDLFERNRALMEAGRTETVQVDLSREPRSVLHLVLGGQPLAVIETADPAGEEGGPEDDASQDASIADLFPDFDAYRDPTR